MLGASHLSAIWFYTQSAARLTEGPLSAELDIERPQLGLRNLSWQSVRLPGQVLGIRWEAGATAIVPGRDPHWPLMNAETYVRGNDLVATYLAEPAWPYRPQIYWRANLLEHEPQVLASLMLLISIQTDLLDTRPRLNVVSHLAADELLHVTISDHDCSTQLLTGERTQLLNSHGSVTCVVARLRGIEASYVECVPASDFQELWVSPADDPSGVSKLEWQLFHEFLEKGVIRRARVTAAFLPRENDVRLAAELCRTMEKLPLPLTT